MKSQHSWDALELHELLKKSPIEMGLLQYQNNQSLEMGYTESSPDLQSSFFIKNIS